MRCAHCNSKLTKKNKFCPECGAAVVWTEIDKWQEEGRKNRVVIIVLGVLLVLAFVIIAGLLVLNNGDVVTPPSETETTLPPLAFSEDPTAISEAAGSVVKLNCYTGGDIIATGSGFAAFQRGVIVTNYHVIEDQPQRIEMVAESGQKYDLTGVVGVSKERDIAILYYQPRGENFDLPILPVNSSVMLQKGEKVVAIGSPLGLTNVVSAGVFSGYTNSGDVTDIQFTASISSGSSGGALFNDHGEVIGITYASFEAGQNLNLAVPMEFVESLWKTESKDRMLLDDFYTSLIPHYTVDYVLEHYKELKNTVFYLDCWLSSYGESSGNYIIYFAPRYSDIYDPNQNVAEVRFQKDNDRYTQSSLIKAVGPGSGDTLSKLRLEMWLGSRGEQKSIKCVGVEWSPADQKPYVIPIRG